MGNHNSAFFIFDVVIHDEAALKPYLDNVAASYKAFGGKRIVMGGECQTIEGNAPAGHLVILQFDNIEQAQAWHDSPPIRLFFLFALTPPRPMPGWLKVLHQSFNNQENKNENINYCFAPLFRSITGD